MAVLQCDAVSCTYNKEKLCSKGDILVGGKQADKCKDTCCASFREETGSRVVSALEHACKTISIDCEAEKCVYNSNYKCSAEKVRIGGNRAGCSKDTICETFKEK